MARARSSLTRLDRRRRKLLSVVRRRGRWDGGGLGRGARAPTVDGPASGRTLPPPRSVPEVGSGGPGCGSQGSERTHLPRPAPGAFLGLPCRRRVELNACAVCTGAVRQRGRVCWRGKVFPCCFIKRSRERGKGLKKKKKCSFVHTAFLLLLFFLNDSKGPRCYLQSQPTARPSRSLQEMRLKEGT